MSTFAMWGSIAGVVLALGGGVLYALVKKAEKAAVLEAWRENREVADAVHQRAKEILRKATPRRAAISDYVRGMQDRRARRRK